MGVAAILADAVVWACTTTFITSRLSRIDFLSVATVRLVFATAFIWPALFILGAQDDLWRMSFDTMWQLFLGALAGYTLAEPGYALTLSFLGLTRGYTLVIGMFSLAAFVMPVIFLDETVSLQAAGGGLLIVAGVIIVTFRGRALRPTPAFVGEGRAPQFAGSDERARAGSVHPRAGATAAPASVRIPGTPLALPRLLGSPRILGGVVVGVVTAILWAIGPTIFTGEGRAPQPAGSDERARAGSVRPRAGATAARPPVRIPGTPLVLPRILAGVVVGVVTAILWVIGTTILRALRSTPTFVGEARAPQPAGSDERAYAGPVRSSAGATAAPASVRIPGTSLVLPRILAGVVVGVVTAILWATGTTILRALAPGIDAAAVATAQLTPAVATSVIVFLLVRRGRIFGSGATPGTVSLIGLTGAMTAGLGTILVVFAVQRVGAGPTAVLFAMSTIFALPLGVIFLKERVTVWGIVGAAIAVGGVALLV